MGKDVSFKQNNGSCDVFLLLEDCCPVSSFFCRRKWFSTAWMCHLCAGSYIVRDYVECRPRNRHCLQLMCSAAPQAALSCLVLTTELKAREGLCQSVSVERRIEIINKTVF